MFKRQMARKKMSMYDLEYTPDYSKRGYNPIDMTKIQKDAQDMKSNIERVNLLNFTPDSLKELGSGIVLYFWLLRKLRYMFYISFIITLPTIIVALMARGEASDTDIGFYGTTIGKFVLTVAGYDENGESIKKLFINNNESDGLKYANMVSYLDLIASIVMLMMSYNMIYESTDIADDIDDTTITIDDYAVAVKNLPDDATEHEIYVHFNKLYSLDETVQGYGKRPILGHDSFDVGVIVDPDDPMNAKGPISQKKIGHDGKYVGDLTCFPTEYFATHRGKYKGSWIYDVTLLHDCREWILLYKSSPKLLSDIKRERANISYYVANNQINSKQYYTSIRKLSNLLVKRDDIIKTGEIMSETGQAVVGAIIIFANEESRYRCLEEYKESNFFGGQPSYLKFRGETKITVTQAYHPTDYLWEFYSEKFTTLLGFRTLTALITIVLLIISIAISAWGDSISRNYTKQAPTSVVCGSYLPLIYSRSHTGIDPPYTFVRNETMDERCQDAYGDDGLTWYYIYYDTQNTSFPNTGLKSYCNSPCTTPTVPDVKAYECSYTYTLGKSHEYVITAPFGCYCSAYITQIMNENDWFTALRKLSVSTDFCYAYTKNYALGLVMSNIFSVLVLLVNTIIQMVINFIIHYERHHLVSFEIGSCAFKIFLAQFINTAIIILITRARGFPGGYRFITGIGLFEGSYHDFSSDWFEFVGSSILLTMTLNIFTSQLMQFVNAFVLKYVYRYLAKGYKYSVDLVELYAGNEFNVAARLPVVTTAAFVCWFYSGGMPLLFVLVGTLFLFQYYVDAYNILYEFRRPPAYAAFLLLDTINMVPYGVFLHMMVSIYMLSEPYLFYDSKDGRGIINVLGGNHTLKPQSDINTDLSVLDLQFGLRLSRVHIYPYFVIFMILIVTFIFWKIAGRYIYRVLQALNIIKYEVDDLEHLPSLAGYFEISPLHPEIPYELPDYLKDDGYCVLETQTLEGYSRLVLRKKRQEDGSYYHTVEYLEEEDTATYRMRKNKKYGLIDKLIGDYERFYPGLSVKNTYEFDGESEQRHRFNRFAGKFKNKMVNNNSQPTLNKKDKTNDDNDNDDGKDDNVNDDNLKDDNNDSKVNLKDENKDDE